jgi:hypothetical protein
MALLIIQDRFKETIGHGSPFNLKGCTHVQKLKAGFGSLRPIEVLGLK